MTPTSNPPDLMENARGHFVPVAMVPAVDLLRDQTVNAAVAEAKAMSAQLASFKSKLRSDIASFIALSAEQFDVKWGGRKGNVSLVSFDGRRKIVVAMDESIEFDERLQIAKQLIDECLGDLTADAKDELKTLVDSYFRVDQQGNISTSLVLSLRRHKITHPKWLEAMRAINESILVTGSKEYLRVYERNAQGQMVMIPLDIGGV